MGDKSRLARSLHFSLGKCTAEVKTKVSDEDKEDFERFCRQQCGASPAEVLRDFILSKTRGVDVIRSLYESRLSVVSSWGPGNGSIGGGNE